MSKKLASGRLLLTVLVGVLLIVCSSIPPLSALFAQENGAQPSPQKPGEKPAEPEATAPQPVQVSPEALALLEEARKQLRSYRSIKADLTETVLFGPQTFRAEGSYLQRGESEILFEFKVTIDGADGKPLIGNLLEVCNGQILWMSYKVGPDLQVTRRNIEQIMEAARESPSIDSELLTSQLGLGGISGLLASMQRSMAFESISLETVDGNQYQMIEGGWSGEYLEKLKPPGAGENFVLPNYVPDRVRIFFDEKSKFPRRILYLKTIEGKSRPMLALDFFNVQTNVPIANETFVFTLPKDVIPQDITQDVIAQIKAASAKPATPPEQPKE